MAAAGTNSDRESNEKGKKIKVEYPSVAASLAIFHHGQRVAEVSCDPNGVAELVIKIDTGVHQQQLAGASGVFSSGVIGRSVYLGV